MKQCKTYKYRKCDLIKQGTIYTQQSKVTQGQKEIIEILCMHFLITRDKVFKSQTFLTKDS